MACDPDVIFIGGWLAGSYDALSQIAPVVYLATDSDLGVVESVRQNTRAIASLFGLEDTAGELMTGFDSRVAALASFSEGRTAIVWAWLPAAASMCGATMVAAHSSAGKRALPTWGRTPSPAPPPTATRPASSSSRSAAVPPAECFRLLFRLFELAIYSLYYSYNEYIKIINCYSSDIMNIYTE